MGIKPECKSSRPRNILTKSRPLSKTKTATQVRSSSNVKVVVRVRPPSERESGDNSKTIIKVVDKHLLIFDPKTKSQAFFFHGVEQKNRDLLQKANKDMQFMFDRVFAYESTNNDLFDTTTKNLINCLMDGYNCTVFAYGATGAGKTHTMLGSNNNPGITYLTMAELFKTKQALNEERNFELGVSYIEVYNELVYDLLNPGAPLQLRDDGKYGVIVAGIKIHKIENAEELFTLLAQGNSNRTQHPTDANAESSRSHAVFQVYIKMEFKATREVCTSKLSMIDLAGSERGSVTGCRGGRFAEGANINKSLLALGNCINSLADGQKYVPYRDSKLTRLLKDSLCGNCQTVMIANVSPSSLCYDDTYNTLKYAMRAKKIKSEVKKNVVNVELHAGEYVKIVEELRKELEKVKAKLKEKSEEKSVEKKVNNAALLQVAKVIDDRKALLDRIYNIECSKHKAMLRRQLEEDADAWLSSLITNDSEKEEAHRQLGKVVNRFHHQEDTLRNKLTELKLAKVELEHKTADLVRQFPEFGKKVELENEKLCRNEWQYQTELMQKKCTALEEDLKSRTSLLEKICTMLQSCYLQLRGHGFPCQEYQSLVNHLQGRKHITWDSPVDSGLGSTTSISSTEGDLRAVKRKINDENINWNTMDSAFVMEVPKPKVKVCEEIMTKVYKTPHAIEKKRDAMHLSIENKRTVTMTRQHAVERKIASKPDLTKKRPKSRKLLI